MTASNTKSEAETCWAVGFNDQQALDEPYGKPVSPEAAAAEFGSQRSAKHITALIFKDGSIDAIKPKRPNPSVFAGDFLSSLVKAPNGRWYFSGFLNGWGSYTLFEVASLEIHTLENESAASKKRQIYWQSNTGAVRRKSFLRNLISPFVSAANDAPSFPSKGVSIVKATLYRPQFLDKNFSRASPGLVWWYFGSSPQISDHKFSFGTNVISACESQAKETPSKATMAHHFMHRYAKLVETDRDRREYHSGVFVEWDHGKHATIFELAWRGGVSGYNGKANWVEDKNAKPSSALYNFMPKELKGPWESDTSEIRVFDVPYANLDEFKKYLEKYTGGDKRFIDPQIVDSASVVVKGKTKPDLAKLLLNRIIADSKYNVAKDENLSRNCQTFSGTFFSVLTKKAALMPSVKKPLVAELEYFSKSYVDGSQMKIEYE